MGPRRGAGSRTRRRGHAPCRHAPTRTPIQNADRAIRAWLECSSAKRVFAVAREREHPLIPGPRRALGPSQRPGRPSCAEPGVEGDGSVLNRCPRSHGARHLGSGRRAQRPGARFAGSAQRDPEGCVVKVRQGSRLGPSALLLSPARQLSGQDEPERLDRARDLQRPDEGRESGGEQSEREKRHGGLLCGRHGTLLGVGGGAEGGRLGVWLDGHVQGHSASKTYASTIPRTGDSADAPSERPISRAADLSSGRSLERPSSRDRSLACARTGGRPLLPCAA